MSPAIVADKSLTGADKSASEQRHRGYARTRSHFMTTIAAGQPLVSDPKAALARLSKMLGDAPGQGSDAHKVFTQVDQSIFRGRLPSRGEMVDLKAVGVKHI